MFKISAVLAFASVIFVTEVASWTVDLPEIRRFYFEKYSNHDNQVPVLNGNQNFFDNINGDSLYNSYRKESDNIDYYRQYLRHLYGTDKLTEKDDKKDIYAKAYNYGAYMVKKVSHGVLQHGSAYLEGLRLSIEWYAQLMENCTRNNFTADFPPLTSQPLTMSNFSNWRDFQESCRRATDVSEHMRRYTDLALHATKRLQDVAYSSKYNKESSMEENELLLRLSWYLDKLAHLTGYEPSPEGFIPSTDRTPTPAMSTSSPFNLTEDMKTFLLNCLNEKSDVPATVRCAFMNQTMPQQMMNYMNRMRPGNNPVTTPPSSVSKRSNDDTFIPALEPEMLEAIATDNREILAPTLTVHKHVQKRSISDEDNPLMKALKYYAKHKMWEYSNPKRENEVSSNAERYYYDVRNSLHGKSVQKRAVHIDEHHIHAESFLKDKPLVHHLADKVKTVKTVLEKLYKKKVAASHAHAAHVLEHEHKHLAHVLEHDHKHHAHEHEHFSHFDHLYRHKRNTDYIGVVKPRIPADPQMDISYYVKNKEGTSYNANVAQALLVRASLEEAFQRGNIEVVHKYGSNYNPADPAPFYTGVLKTSADV